jgi:hypothetical protein
MLPIGHIFTKAAVILVNSVTFLFLTSVYFSEMRVDTKENNTDCHQLYSHRDLF